jgi:16S rRNA U1498 N3-methylase RsmE
VEAERLAVLGWRSAWLGPRVLRAETAVVAAATLALSALGEGGY